MAPALSLLACTTIALAGAALWPRAGQPVLLALPPGVSGAAAFAAPGWRVQRLAAAGPFTLVFAAPDDPGADPARLRRDAGALVSLAATRRADCSPGRKDG
jgi:hypothetical protein